jgi:DNA sulfur modification protein DndD
MVSKEREIEQKETKLGQFDFEENKTTDIRYETLKKLPSLFDTLSERLLEARKSVIEQNMKDHLNKLIKQLEGMVGRVELIINKGEISFKIYHIRGNEIVLEGLSAGGKQILIQLLLKELRDHGDYDPPVMIDSVMANFDDYHRKRLLEYYFPHIATQAILFSTDRDITPDEDGYGILRPYIAKAYLLDHHPDEQYTSIDEGYFNNYK